MIYLQYAGDVHICRKHLEPIIAVFWQSVWGTPIPAQQTQAFCCIKYILSIRYVDVLGMQTYQACCCMLSVYQKVQRAETSFGAVDFLYQFLETMCYQIFSLFYSFSPFSASQYKQKFKRKWKFCFQTFSKKGKNLKGLAELQYSTVRKGKGWYRIDNKNLLGLGVNKLTPPQVPGGTPCHRNSYYQYSTVQYNLL